MPSGKETRLLHLGEMEKLDKTLFRLEQGGSGAAAFSASCSSARNPRGRLRGNGRELATLFG